MRGWSLGLGLSPSSGPDQLRLTKKKSRLAFGILITVRRMNRVSLLRFGVELSHRPVGCIFRVSRADGGAERGNGVALLEYHRHRWARRHERDERRKEGPFAMHGVEFPRLSVAEMQDTRGADAKTLLFEMGDDLSCLAASECVGFDDGEREIAGHW